MSDSVLNLTPLVINSDLNSLKLYISPLKTITYFLSLEKKGCEPYFASIIDNSFSIMYGDFLNNHGERYDFYRPSSLFSGTFSVDFDLAT